MSSLPRATPLWRRGDVGSAPQGGSRAADEQRDVHTAPNFGPFLPGIALPPSDEKGTKDDDVASLVPSLALSMFADLGDDAAMWERLPVEPGRDPNHAPVPQPQRGLKAVFRHEWPNGDRYEGEFHHGVMQGYGTYWYAKTGNWYSGQWEEGEKHGLGTFYCRKKTEEYVGNWVKGERQGRGTTANRGSGVVHTGLYKRNRAHGLGTLITAEGRFEGNFAYGKQTGNGSMNFVDGSMYTGMWKAGKFHGTGSLVCADFMYHGQWVSGKMEGRGQCTLSSGNTYVGDYVDGKRHGRGEEFLPDGCVCHGEWKDNVRSGEGTLVYPHGDKCVGTWEDGELHGPGAFVYADGREVNVTFRYGTIVPPRLPNLEILKTPVGRTPTNAWGKGKDDENAEAGPSIQPQ